MKNFHKILLAAVLLFGVKAMAQESASLKGTPVKLVEYTQENSPYLTKEWFRGLARDNAGKPYDGVMLNYDLTKDEVVYKNDSAAFILGPEITEFNIPTGTELFTFKSGFPATSDGLTGKSYYQVLYDGNTKLLKHYKKSGTAATQESLYILKDDKLSPIQLKNRNSFLKILSDEKNKMNYVIKEENLEFDGSDDVAKLLAEYDAYKAGRGGN
jgi:hypothetical protein